MAMPKVGKLGSGIVFCMSVSAGRSACRLYRQEARWQFAQVVVRGQLVIEGGVLR